MRFKIVTIICAFALNSAIALAAPADGVLNRYYAMKKSSPAAAFDFLSKQAGAHGSDIRVRLELGYYLLSAGRKDAARIQFEAAVRIEPNRADLWKQIGYIEIDLRRDESALAAFRRALEINPRDEQVSLQIAYLLDKLGRRREAASQFRTTIRSANAETALKSCTSYSNLRGLPDRMLPDPFFAETYFAPEYNSKWRLGVLPLQMRLGATLSTEPRIEAYLSVRSTWDTRSGAGSFGSQIYNDNAAVFAGGLRIKPVESIPLFFFIEGGEAYDIVNRNRERWRGDVRGGFQYFQEWNTDLRCDPDTRTIRPIADLYADGIYYSRYDNNVLFFGRFRPGLRLFETETFAVDSYIHAAVNADTRGVADNNFQEIGLGLALRLYDPLRLTLRGEGMRVVRHDGLASYNTFRLRLEHQSRF